MAGDVIVPEMDSPFRGKPFLGKDGRGREDGDVCFHSVTKQDDMHKLKKSSHSRVLKL